MPSLSSPSLSSYAILLGACSLPALAESDIDLVDGDDIARRGELSTELAARCSQTARASDVARRSLWQAVGELSYGVTDNFNVGIKLPLSRTDGSWHGHGAYVELRYVAPQAADGFYWGAEIEAGSIKGIGEERAFVIEASPILGYRVDRFQLTGNPGVELSSKGDDKGWAFSPKAKVAYRLNERHAVGVEYHIDAGKFGDFLPRTKRSEMAYLTWEARLIGQQFSFALGHGATQGSDRWAARVGIELDD